MGSAMTQAGCWGRSPAVETGAGGLKRDQAAKERQKAWMEPGIRNRVSGSDSGGGIQSERSEIVVDQAKV